MKRKKEGGNEREVEKREVWRQREMNERDCGRSRERDRKRMRERERKREQESDRGREGKREESKLECRRAAAKSKQAVSGARILGPCWRLYALPRSCLLL